MTNGRWSMTNKDELLQQQLDALERGQPLKSVLDGLPEQERDLAPIIRLAAAVRELPHPDLLPEQYRSQQKKIAAAAVGQTNNHRNSNPSSPKKTAWNKWSWTLVPALALGGVIML